MVLLSMTPAMVDLLQNYPELQQDEKSRGSSNEPSLEMPETGKPISHGQVLDIYKKAKERRKNGSDQIRLHDLLKGSQVYVPAAEPRPEPTSEYKQLMARLRREEESKAYARMLNPVPKSKNPFEKFVAPKTSAAWDLSNAENEIDDMKMSEVNQQLALIINVLVSIIACGIAAWFVFRHWSVATRLALSMSCGGVVGIAEVGIYAVYVWKLGEAKAVEKSKKEEKVITDTWVIEGLGSKRAGGKIAHYEQNNGEAGLRKRKVDK